MDCRNDVEIEKIEVLIVISTARTIVIGYLKLRYYD